VLFVIETNKKGVSYICNYFNEKAYQYQLYTHEKSVKTQSGISTQHTQIIIAFGAVSVPGYLKFAGQLGHSKTEPIDPVFQGLGCGNPPAQFFHNVNLFPNCGPIGHLFWFLILHEIFLCGIPYVASFSLSAKR
jgi:hypothetical protein